MKGSDWIYETRFFPSWVFKKTHVGWEPTTIGALRNHDRVLYLQAHDHTVAVGYVMEYRTALFAGEKRDGAFIQWESLQPC